MKNQRKWEADEVGRRLVATTSQPAKLPAAAPYRTHVLARSGR